MKVLSVLLSITMVLAMLPVNAFADETDQSQQLEPSAGLGSGAVTLITSGGTVNGSTVSYGESELPYYEADPSVGRNVPGYWIGILVTAPEGYTEGAMYGYSDDNMVKSFDANKDGNYYIQLWGRITEEFLNTAKEGGTNLAYNWSFDWDGDGSVDQKVQLIVNPDDISLNSDNVARIGAAEYATLALALEAANPGDTVTLIKDIVSTDDADRVKIEKSVTLDMNGHSINANYNQVLTVLTGVEATIMNGSIYCTGGHAFVSAGVNTTLINFNSTATSSSSYALYIAGGDITMIGCNFVSEKSYAARFVSGEVSMNACTLTSTSLYAALIQNGNITMTDCDISTVSNNAVAITNGVVSMNDCTITSNNQFAFLMENGELYLTGCNLTSDRSIGAYIKAGNVSMTGCTVTAEASYGIYNAAANITLTDTTVTSGGIAFYSSNGDVTLNGSTLVSEGESKNDVGLYLLGGTASVEDTDITSYYDTVYLGASSITLTIDQDSTITSTNGNGINAWGGGNTLHVYGTIISPNACIATNGTNSSENSNNTIYIYDGAYLQSVNLGMYLPALDSTTVIYGGTISGKTGIEIRAGDLTVNGGTIIGTATPTETQPNGSGSTTLGSGIAISQHTTKQPINVTVSGGEISGFSAVYEHNPQGNSAEDISKVSIEITDGTFNAINGGTVSVYSEDKVVAISGGTFSSDVSEHVAEGFEVITDGNGNFIIGKEPVAGVGSDNFETIEEAVQAAENIATSEEAAEVVLKESSTETSDISEAIAVIANSEANISLTVPTSTGTVTFNNEAVTNIQEKATGDISVSVVNTDNTEDTAVYEITLVGADVSEAANGFGENGEATILIPIPDGFTVPFVYYINGSEKTLVESEVVDGYVSFVATHFSTYSIEDIGDNVAEVNGTLYSSLVDAVNAAPEGATIKLIADVDYTDIAIDSSNPLLCRIYLKNKTLDLNGHVLNLDKNYIFVTLNATGTVMDSQKTGKITGNNSYMFLVYGNIDIINCTIEGGSTTSGALFIQRYDGYPSATANIDGCTITSDEVGICISNGEAEIKNSTVTAKKAVYAESNNTVIENCIINSNSCGVEIWDNTNVVIKKTYITVNGKVNPDYSGVFFAGSHSSVTVDSETTITVHTVERPTEKTQSLGIFCPQADCTINFDGKIVADDQGIVTNGEAKNSGNTINVYENADITAEIGIYAPSVDSVTNIYGGRIEGYSSAVEIRAGTLNIEGGEFIATCPEYSCTPNGSGSTTTGAAIAIAQHTTQNPIIVNITGGTFTGAYSVSEANPENNEDPEINISIEEGIFDGEITAENCEEFITGGTFSTDVSEYCPEELAAVPDGNGNYVIDNAPVVAMIGEDSYYSIASAVKAANNGDTIKLMANANGAFTVAEDMALTLDLNGYELKAGNGTSTQIKVYGTLTVEDSTDTDKNGTGTGRIYTDSLYSEGNTTSLIMVYGNGELIVNSGLIDAATEITDNTNEGQFAISVVNSANVTVNGGKIKAGWYAISGNGSKTNGSTITVNGGIIESTADYAIYHPQNGDLIINDGVIYGVAGGIAMKGGYLEVNGGTITSKGTGSTGTWGDGTGNLGAAALNVSKLYTDAEVVITGGKFIAENGALIVSETTGKNADIAISGGTFSSILDPEYCADGFVPTTEAVDGMYTVEEGTFIVEITSRILGVDNTTIANLTGGGAATYVDGTEVTAPVVSGYNFLGWYDNESASGTALSTNNTFTYHPTKDTTVYAIYEATSKFELKVNGSRFTVNGGTEQYISYDVPGASGNIVVNYTGTDTFLYWVNSSNNIVSTDPEYSFVLVGPMTLTAISSSSETSSYFVIFRNAYNQVISYERITGNAINVPASPSKMGSTFSAWTINGEEAGTDPASILSKIQTFETGSWIELKPAYVQNEGSYTVTVSNNVNSDTKEYTVKVGASKNVTAEDTLTVDETTYYFSHWELDGVMVSSATTFRVISNATDAKALVAIYTAEKEAAEAVNVITQKYASADGSKYKITATMQYALPEGATLIQAGFVYSANSAYASEELVLGAENSYTNISDLTAASGTYTLNIRTSDAGKTIYLRGYAVYSMDGETVTIYTGLVSGSYNSLS